MRSLVIPACHMNDVELSLAPPFVRQDDYVGGMPSSIGKGTNVPHSFSLTLTCAAGSKSMLIVVALSGWTGTRSNRNFHRPQ